MRLLFSGLAAFSLLCCFFLAAEIAQPGNQPPRAFLLGALCVLTVELTVAAARRSR